MKTKSSSFFVLALASCFLTAALSAAPSTDSTSQNHTASGKFQTSAGLKGTYEETVSIVGVVATDKIVYTSADGTETSTVEKVTTTNTDGTKTVAFSDIDFGATAAFISTTTYSAPIDRSAVGTGTFTAADGTAGTLVSIITRTAQTRANSINFTSAAGALTRQVRLEERGGPCDELKVVDVDVLGELTSKTILRCDEKSTPHQ